MIAKNSGAHTKCLLTICIKIYLMAFFFVYFSLFYVVCTSKCIYYIAYLNSQLDSDENFLRTGTGNKVERPQLSFMFYCTPLFHMRIT